MDELDPVSHQHRVVFDGNPQLRATPLRNRRIGEVFEREQMLGVHQQGGLERLPGRERRSNVVTSVSHGMKAVDDIGLVILVGLVEFDDAEPGIIKLEHVDKVLRTVYDPEIPVNILDLGLVYARRVESKNVSIDMTLTAPACGMGDVLRAEVARRLKQVPNVEHVEVNLVFKPQWNRSMLSEVAKLELGMF